MSLYVACLVLDEAEDEADDDDDEEDDVVGAAEKPTYDDPNPVSIEWDEWSFN